MKNKERTSFFLPFSKLTSTSQRKPTEYVKNKIKLENTCVQMRGANRTEYCVNKESVIEYEMMSFVIRVRERSRSPDKRQLLIALTVTVLRECSGAVAQWSEADLNGITPNLRFISEHCSRHRVWNQIPILFRRRIFFLRRLQLKSLHFSELRRQFIQFGRPFSVHEMF